MQRWAALCPQGLATGPGAHGHRRQWFLRLWYSDSLLRFQNWRDDDGDTQNHLDSAMTGSELHGFPVNTKSYK